jgi:Rieske 2Fe-2S family protein
LLGSITEPRLGDVHFWTFNSWHHFMSDHAVCIHVLPLAPDRTLVRTKWLVASDAVEGVHYDVDTLTAVWRATNQQDGALVARTHAGVADPAFRPGQYSVHAETYLDYFATWYLDRLRAHGV